MFAVDDLSSFELLRLYKRDFLNSHGSLGKPLLLYLVISKTDIPRHEWKVEISEAQEMADEFNAKLHLISSKNNEEE